MDPEDFNFDDSNNQPVNPGQESNQNGAQNNNGQTPQLDDFWSQGNDETSSNPDPSQQGNALGREILATLQSFNTGSDLMSAEMISRFNEGDFTGFNNAFRSHMQEAARQQLLMNVKLMEGVRSQLLNELRNELKDTFKTKDDSDFLAKNIPSAADPKTRPMVQRVFEQAMRIAKGNRQEAIETTKSMIKAIAETTAKDLGYSVAPRSPGENRNESGQVLTEDLLTRLLRQ